MSPMMVLEQAALAYERAVERLRSAEIAVDVSATSIDPAEIDKALERVSRCAAQAEQALAERDAALKNVEASAIIRAKTLLEYSRIVSRKAKPR